MTTKKPTESKASQEQSVAATPSPEEVLARYMDAVKTLDLVRQQIEASGIKLEIPPSESAVVRDGVPSPEQIAARKTLPEVPPVTPQQFNENQPGASIGNGNYRPWTKQDLKGQEKFSLVPVWIPGSVHPIRDENGKHHIFLDVNGLTCSLILWEPQEVSGMFFHAYQNILQAWKDSEEYKAKGPVNAPWVSGGLHGSNTWSYQAEAPSAWLNLDGGYYKPGDQMPNDEIAQ